MALAIRPLDVSTWSDFAGLAEDHHGVWDGCWCLGFHEEGRPHGYTPEQRRALKETRVREGRAHAALVFDGEPCIGWCQFGPTEELPRIKHQRAYRDGLRQLPDWRITCFFVGRTHRQRGVADAALAGAWAEVARLGGGTSRATPRTRTAARCRDRFSTTALWRCSSATASHPADGSASTDGLSAGAPDVQGTTKRIIAGA